DSLLNRSTCLARGRPLTRGVVPRLGGSRGPPPRRLRQPVPPRRVRPGVADECRHRPRGVDVRGPRLRRDADPGRRPRRSRVRAARYSGALPRAGAARPRLLGRRSGPRQALTVRWPEEGFPMTTAATPAPVPEAETTWPRRWKWTREKYHHLAELGI